MPVTEIHTLNLHHNKQREQRRLIMPTHPRFV